MLKKILFSFFFGMTLMLTGCATSNEGVGDSALVEDPTSTDNEILGMEEGAVIVGDNYQSSNESVSMTAEQKAKLEALKQDAVIHFAFDSDAIPNNYISVLQAHAQFLRDTPIVTVIIEGHTDERGTPEYNIALGERRARSVASYLMNLGVSANQLSIVSYGKEKPMVNGHDENAYSRNRRAVISY